MGKQITVASTLLRPLSSRSVVLSTLLGAHPPCLPARALIHSGEIFGISEGTIRVALSRMVAAGDLTQDGGSYCLTERLRHRQARQDEARTPHARAWDGDWELAIVTAPRRDVQERSALREAMATLRLAELREGTWLRPANLDRPWPPVVTAQCTTLRARPDGDPAQLSATLWDLDGWAEHSRQLLHALDDADTPADRFMVAAAVHRHLLTDPVLPPALLPDDWPGPELRARFDAFDTVRSAVGRSGRSRPAWGFTAP